MLTSLIGSTSLFHWSVSPWGAGVTSTMFWSVPGTVSSMPLSFPVYSVSERRHSYKVPCRVPGPRPPLLHSLPLTCLSPACGSVSTGWTEGESLCGCTNHSPEPQSGLGASQAAHEGPVVYTSPGAEENPKPKPTFTKPQTVSFSAKTCSEPRLWFSPPLPTSCLSLKCKRGGKDLTS